MVRGNILIVDDVFANVELLSIFLREKGYEPRGVLSGQLALEAARESKPDLILLDITMPIMDGFAVCDALKSDPTLRAVPVIFLSALSETEDKVRAFKAGGVDYITKPFRLEEVIARVETQIQLARQRAELEQRYEQIAQLQAMIQQFVSQSAWARIEADARSHGNEDNDVRRLTILFTDIAGYTALSERMELFRLAADLSSYMNLVTQIIASERGEVDKYVGDGVLAFFTDAGAAVRAAVTIQGRLADPNLIAQGVAFPTRIGLTTGNVLLLRLGAEGRREYTIIGDRVNVASRLHNEVEAGGIIMDEATFIEAGQPAGATHKSIAVRGKTNIETFFVLSTLPPGVAPT